MFYVLFLGLLAPIVPRSDKTGLKNSARKRIMVTVKTTLDKPKVPPIQLFRSRDDRVVDTTSRKELGKEKSKIPRAVPIAKDKKLTAANVTKKTSSDVNKTDKIKVQLEEIPIGNSTKDDIEITSLISTPQSGKFQLQVSI